MIIIACAALFGATQAKAQGQSLPILTANPDSKTASMGNASVASDGMYLYNTPSAFFNTDKRFTSDASVSLYEKEDGAQGLSLIHISEPTRPVCSSRMPSSA